MNGFQRRIKLSDVVTRHHLIPALNAELRNPDELEGMSQKIAVPRLVI